MAVPCTAEAFLDLVQKSGVVDNERHHAYLAKLRATGPLFAEPAEVAESLVRDGILTFFQAGQLLRGRWRRFSIGGYKVLEHLGAGKQASIYLCQHTILQRRVAVKVLPAARNSDRTAVQRLMRECRILAYLDHPNIVRVYDLGQDDTLYYLALEYVDGSSLQQIVESCGPMDVTRAAHYIRQAALALQHVCDQGVVHRDLKPGDILVDRGGGAKLIDMGLARLSCEEEAVSVKRFAEVVLGTPDYMAPEQAIDPHSVDVRADIYSLGATFYFCLTRYTPFRGGTPAEKLLWHQTRQPEPVRQLRPKVPVALAALIERMMGKEPVHRPQTPQEVADALAPYTSRPIGPPPEDEMPRLSPAASGGQPPAFGTDRSW